jgi:hypothetical protein
VARKRPAPQVRSRRSAGEATDSGPARSRGDYLVTEGLAIRVLTHEPGIDHVTGIAGQGGHPAERADRGPVILVAHSAVLVRRLPAPCANGRPPNVPVAYPSD